MQFDFASLIRQLNSDIKARGNFAFAISKARVIPSEYLFLTSILPMRLKPTFDVNGGSIKIYPTMAQLTPMSTPYLPIGFMESSTQKEQTAKFTGMMNFPEETLRELMDLERQLAMENIGNANGGAVINAQRVNVLLNFAEMLLKSQWDNYEYCAGKALTEGVLQLTGTGGQYVNVDYGVPAANIKNRTSTESYYNTATKYKDDVRFVGSVLKTGFVQVMNQNTYQSVIDNVGTTGNNLQVVVNDGARRELVFQNTSQLRPIDDVRDRIKVIVYNKSATLLNALGEKITKPMLDDGRIICIGEEMPDGFNLLEGSVNDETRKWELGYTHIAPTVESATSGFFQKIYTPQDEDYTVIGKTASNGLPMMINPNRLVILKTGMPS